MLKLIFAACAVSCGLSASAFAIEKSVTAEIHDKTGATLGHVKVYREGKGVTFQVEVTGMKPGLHGIHVHSVGKCEGPDFKSSGSHFAFTGQMHGMDNPKGPHLGDMPNLNVKANGKGKMKFRTDLVTLQDAENSLRKPGGTSLIIHDKQDDQKTDPSGGSGDRVACAVLFP